MSASIDDYGAVGEGFDPGAPADDDWTLMPIAAPSRTAEEIDAENSFRTVPPGDHTLVVVGVTKKEEKRFNVQVGAKVEGGEWQGGMTVGFTGINLQVRLALESDRGAQITDFFTACADGDATSVKAYYEGVQRGASSRSQGGFHANKFYHFLGMLGYDWPKGGSLPAEALNPRNWVGKRVAATVVEGNGTYTATDKATGQQVERKRGNQVKMFSYKRPAGRAQGSAPAPPAPPQQQQQRPAAAPAPNRAARAGLNAV